MLLTLLQQGVIHRAIGLIFKNPFPRKSPALDLLKNFTHGPTGLLRNDPGSPRDIAIFGRGADRIPHVRDATLVNQIHN